jgi:hypothetical protein
MYNKYSRLTEIHRQHRAWLGVLYMDPDMHNFLTEYYSSVVLALHASRYRAAQVE